MANKLPSGRWRGRVVDLTGTQVAPWTIIGGPKTYKTRRQAERAEDDARDQLLAHAERGKTVAEFWAEWITSPEWAPSRSQSTLIHHRERTRRFVAQHGELPLRAVGDEIVGEWLIRLPSSIPALRTMFSDAKRVRLITTNPFYGLGLQKSKGRKHVKPPDQAAVARMLQAAERLTPPSYAAWLTTAVHSGMRPGELDGLKWQDVDLTRGEITVQRQWNVKTRCEGPTKSGRPRTITIHPAVIERLRALPRESEWVFTTTRGNHYTPSTRNHHWNRVRCASGLETVDLYLATRHHCGWLMLNVLHLPPHVIGLHLGHTDGGKLVASLYGHPDEDIARKEIREAFGNTATVTAIKAA